MKTFLFSILFFCWVVLCSAQLQLKRGMQLMGCGFEITVVAQDSLQAESYIELARQEISRIENLISSWKEGSQTWQINQQAGISPVKVDWELLDLISRAKRISTITDGAFDISYASSDKLWYFDGRMKQLPTAEEVAKSVELVGFEKIIINEKDSTVFLQKPGMKIGFGAVGKGYAADKAKALLLSKGVAAGVVNASGDMVTWGRQVDGTDWNVGITHPFNKKKIIGKFELDGGAVVTSGDYERYVEFDGVRYSHIIDPRTGYPARGLVSVTVFAPSAELADALATSVFVMGKDIGLDRIEQLKQVECIVVDEKGVIFASSGIELNYEEN